MVTVVVDEDNAELFVTLYDPLSPTRRTFATDSKYVDGLEQLHELICGSVTSFLVEILL